MALSADLAAERASWNSPEVSNGGAYEVAHAATNAVSAAATAFVRG